MRNVNDPTVEECHTAAGMLVKELVQHVHKRDLLKNTSSLPYIYQQDLHRMVENVNKQVVACSSFVPQVKNLANLKRLQSKIAQVHESIDDFDKWLMLARLSA